MSFPFFPMPFGTFPVCRRTFGLSKPRHGTVGHSVSSLGPVGSWQSAHRVQQTASDSRIYAFFKREQRHSFIWARESRSSLTSSVYVNKDSSCTFIPERSIPPPKSSDLSLSSCPDEGDLKLSHSSGGGSTHSKVKKIKLRHA